MYQQQLQNFTNENYTPDVTNYIQYPDPSQNEPFNRATFPSDKPIIGKHIFAVDSRQRDYEVYPHANNYSLPIPDKYRNVTGIELKAAMLPRTEYNVNSCNKYLDFSVGDYIATITVKNPSKLIRDNNGEGQFVKQLDGSEVWEGKPAHGIKSLEIDKPIIEVGTPATASVEIVDGYITNYQLNSNIHITNGGVGYSHSKLPSVSIPGTNYTKEDFIVTVGKLYNAELREGQYVIGGNPEMGVRGIGATSDESQQSWVPLNLVAEIENAMSYAILTQNLDAVPHIPPGLAAGTPETYCYARKAWADYPTSSGSTFIEWEKTDYPLLFTARIMSQYPSVDTYYGPPMGPLTAADRTNVHQCETNSCRYNRLYITNVLIFRTTGGHHPGEPLGDSPFNYTVLKVDNIPGGDQIVYCNLNDALTPMGAGRQLVDWRQLKSDPHAHWEFLFASGENQIINCGELLGFNKKNYYHAVIVPQMHPENPLTESSTDPIQITHFETTVLSHEQTTLIPKGITYSSENDYYLIGDPEYIVLSFRSNTGGNSFDVLNDRVDSNTNSNINGVFACLIFDATQPAVLEAISAGHTAVY